MSLHAASMYAVQEGIKLGKKDPAAKTFLVTVMDQLQEVSGCLLACALHAVTLLVLCML